MNDPTYRSLRKHLLLIAVTRGAIFWYAIEKLYYLQGGVTLQQVVLLGMLSQLAKLVFEVPTSVFADRWSRRNTLLASALTMIASVTIMGFSSSLPGFLLAIVIWSLSDALRSGVDEAFVYDNLRVKGWQKHYRKVQARMASVEWTSMTIASLIAGWLGHVFNLRLIWFLTVIPYIFYMIVLLRMKEPPITRTKDHGENWFAHLSGATKIMRARNIRWMVLLSSIVIGFTLFWYSNYQLVGIDIAMPAVLFGVLVSALTLGQAFGAEISHYRSGTKRWLLLSWSTVAIAMLAGLRLTNTVIVLVNFFVLLAALRMLKIYIEVFLHDHIPSERRATILSLIGTLSFVWYFLMTGSFTLLLNRYGVRQASTIVSIPILLFALFDISKGLNWATDKKAPLELTQADHVIN